jgi:hypothetical protein
MTQARESFGAELRSRRIGAGLSLTRLGRMIHYSKGYLSKVETGEKLASRDLARRCDAMLGANGELAALVTPSARSAGPVAGDAANGGETWIMRLASGGGSQFVPANDRAALGAGDGPRTGLGTTAARMSAAAREPATMTAFHALFDQSRRLGQAASPVLVLPTVITQTHILRELAAADGEMRGRLLLLAARNAEFAGWMAQEAGQDRAAEWWTRKAVLMARPTGDTTLAAYALVRQAEIALYRDDAAQTIMLARGARRYPRVSRRVHGLAGQREAQGYALTGDYASCRRALDWSAELLDAAGSGEQDIPVLGSSTVSDLGAVTTAWCLFDLGRPREAAEILDREVPRIAVGAQRARARFGVRQALAHAAAGEVDRACVLAERMIGVAELVDSATVRTDIRQLCRTLIRWHSHAPVRDLYPRLSALLHRSAA